MSDAILHSPFGRYRLERHPARRRELLRAWDAADEYLLNRLEDRAGDCGRVLLVNDSFGALSVALHARRPVNWSDSWLAQQACRLNLEGNGLATSRVEFRSSLADPTGDFDTVLIKLPKSLALLDDQMARLKRVLAPSTRIWIAGMARNMPSTLWRRIEDYLGTTTTSRAVKKARIIEVALDRSLPDGDGATPVCWSLDWRGRSWDIFNHANVFSRQGLDIGARFFLEHMPASDGELDIADLGCGNGVLGLAAQADNPEARVHFIDESYMAIESARRNLAQLDDSGVQPRFHVADGLKAFADASLDRVLCNPPFHQQYAIGDVVALSMFRHAARCLRPGGELWVIGNRHLDYHRKLRRWLSRVDCVASNRKFVLLRAVK